MRQMKVSKKILAEIKNERKKKNKGKKKEKNESRLF